MFVLGASAGGTPAIRFALDHPERVTGLILLSSAAPWPSRPSRPPGRMGPPALMNHDWIMWLLSPFFGPVLLLHAQDDRIAPFAPPAGHVQSSMHRYPELTTAIFPTGGHLIVGHGRQVEDTILRFIGQHAG